MTTYEGSEIINTLPNPKEAFKGAAIGLCQGWTCRAASRCSGKKQYVMNNRLNTAETTTALNCCMRRIFIDGDSSEEHTLELKGVWVAFVPPFWMFTAPERRICLIEGGPGVRWVTWGWDMRVWFGVGVHCPWPIGRLIWWRLWRRYRIMAWNQGTANLRLRQSGSFVSKIKCHV